LDFEAPDIEAFPCLRLARQTLTDGGSAPAVLNAANEVAVSAFLQGKIGFLAIPALVEAALEAIPSIAATSLEALLAVDRRARLYTEEFILRSKRFGDIDESSASPGS
jgi:1-deoxy-D-xylulose-5-phosphate reductoisomerase